MRYAVSIVTSTDRESMLMEQLSRGSRKWDVQLTFQNSANPIRLDIDGELTLGRIDATESNEPVYDLTPFGAPDLGVSRKHAVLRWQGTQLMIFDLGGSNGTILNGIRLLPNIGYVLSEGSQLYLGHLLVNVSLNHDVGASSICARRIELDLRNSVSNGKGQRLLLVEDDSGLSGLYRTVLEGAGYTLQVCRDVVSAMRTLNQVTPSMILLDLMLPGIHGLELSRYIRRDADGPEIPIVVISALTDKETVNKALEAGVDVYMRKPTNMRELLSVVAALLAKQEVENPSLHTKLLHGTASLDYIAVAPRKDTIVIFVDGKREPIGAVVQPTLTLGRQSNSPNHVDLESYGAFDQGVSRIHARITQLERGFAIEDLDSSNGTYVNGRALLKSQKATIRNGDELRLGEMRMHVYLLADTDRLAAENLTTDDGSFA